jgi:predicted secreted protein
MAARLGLKAKLFRNTGTFATPTWNEVKNVKDLTLTIEKAEADVTTRGNDGWRALIGTLKSASIEFQMVDDSEDDDFTAFQESFFADTNIEFAIMNGPMIAAPGGVASEGLRATCQVFNFTRNEELENAIMRDVAIKPTYAVNAPEWIQGTVGP